jgi:hypothetical protein
MTATCLSPRYRIRATREATRIRSAQRYMVFKVELGEVPASSDDSASTPILSIASATTSSSRNTKPVK